MRTTEFTVRITGQADDGEMHVRFALEGAREANDETLCGANYYGFATDDTRPANDFDRRINLHEWDISVEAPTEPPTEIDQSVGAYGTPSAAGRRARVCTIEGTAGADRLRGTPGNDVICAFGGRDVVRGRGGHDIVFGGPGADRIDGGRGRDALYGNAGADRIAVRDRSRTVELVG